MQRDKRDCGCKDTEVTNTLEPTNNQSNSNKSFK